MKYIAIIREKLYGAKTNFMQPPKQSQKQQLKKDHNRSLQFPQTGNFYHVTRLEVWRYQL